MNEFIIFVETFRSAVVLYLVALVALASSLMVFDGRKNAKSKYEETPASRDRLAA